MSGDIKEFNQAVEKNIEQLGQSKEMQDLGVEFLRKTAEFSYSYNFTWMGVPVIQFPQDLIAMQELIWRIKPDVIVETGVARGGSIIFYASMMEMMGIDNGQVIGIDIDIREHNREVIQKHPMYKRIQLIEGSSVDSNVVEQVKSLISNKKNVMICLDSMHTEEHVLQELHNYSDFVTNGSYLVVFDTSIDDMPEDFFEDRPWGHNDNPKTAIDKFLQNNRDFEIDRAVCNKLLVTVARAGFLKRKG
ncbi:MAG: cephalosporin hydroxylase [Alteromonas sp.]|nr:cephalosporin hydroxylase [Alteromonas sp.]